MSLEALHPFLPPQTLTYVESLLRKNNIVIKVTNPRQSRHGSFRAGTKQSPSTINISGTLNPYAFLITLLHEIAHLKTWELHSRKASPHGAEWKNIFINLMSPMLVNGIFPEDLKKVLNRHMINPKASSSADPVLVRCLKQYDRKAEVLPTIEELPENAIFEWREGRLFQKKEKLRKRYKCIEIKTKRVYLFSPIAEVKLHQS